jgi:hypothetical protein
MRRRCRSVRGASHRSSKHVSGRRAHAPTLESRYSVRVPAVLPGLSHIRNVRCMIVCDRSRKNSGCGTSPSLAINGKGWHETVAFPILGMAGLWRSLLQRPRRSRVTGAGMGGGGHHRRGDLMSAGGALIGAGAGADRRA